MTQCREDVVSDKWYIVYIGQDYQEIMEMARKGGKGSGEV